MPIESPPCHACDGSVMGFRSNERFKRMIRLRQMALESAYAGHADRFLSIDTDVFLINPDTIQTLADQVQLPSGPELAS